MLLLKLIIYLSYIKVTLKLSYFSFLKSSQLFSTLQNTFLDPCHTIVNERNISCIPFYLAGYY